MQSKQIKLWQDEEDFADVPAGVDVAITADAATAKTKNTTPSPEAEYVCRDEGGELIPPIIAKFPVHLQTTVPYAYLFKFHQAKKA